MISVVVCIYNKDWLITTVLHSIYTNQSDLVKEWILVFDGCTDHSELMVQQYLARLWPSPSLCIKILRLPGVFETRANNAGLKMATQDFVLIVQDDMVIHEKDFDKHLLQPLLRFPDWLFAVTARTSHNVDIKPDETGAMSAFWTDVCEGPVNHRRKATDCSLDRNVLAIRLVVNRGPLLIHHAKLKQLNYFDETYPGKQSSDDLDLCIRAYKQFGWRCGAFWIDYESRLEWGGTRIGPNVKQIANWIDENRRELATRHATTINEYNRRKQDFLLQFSV